MIDPSRARIVDEDVNPPQGREGCVDHFLNFFSLRDVGWNSSDLDAVSSQGLRRLFQLFLAPGANGNVRALLRQLFCDSASQAFARSCDQGAFAFETQVHNQPSPERSAPEVDFFSRDFRFDSPIPTPV
jgi:hypothetical protein